MNRSVRQANFRLMETMIDYLSTKIRKEIYAAKWTLRSAQDLFQQLKKISLQSERSAFDSRTKSLFTFALNHKENRKILVVAGGFGCSYWATKTDDSFIKNTPTILSDMHGDYIKKGNLWNWLKNILFYLISFFLNKIQGRYHPRAPFT
ncbi:unnamed protein product [Lactuca saligna]|uniref:Uncharacterized protein n=1 Tax=Lactuca saligna TaxID=75948 RepID=A0AA36DWI8_LACSI|nr:unnamed protein product [Lactuca saligna]